jgi:hypothetical protein
VDEAIEHAHDQHHPHGQEPSGRHSHAHRHEAIRHAIRRRRTSIIGTIIRTLQAMGSQVTERERDRQARQRTTSTDGNVQRAFRSGRDREPAIAAAERSTSQ